MPENPLQDLFNVVAPHLGFTAKHFERFVAWARYLHWADLHRSRLHTWKEANRQSDDMRPHWELIALMSAYYASLKVVVDGWLGIPLSDASVNELLASNPRYLNLLREFRNCVFHYQPSFMDKRTMNLLREGERVVHWMFFLHEEFCRFYWELAQCPRLSPDLASEIRRSMLDLVGWIPSDSVAARTRALTQKSEDAVTLLREDGDFGSEAALRLLEVARETADGAAEVERDYQRRKAVLLQQIRSSSGPKLTEH